MNLEIFRDLQADDASAFDDFKMSLQANHDTIADRIYSQGLFYRTYPLIDSVPHTKDWQQNLQQELNSIFTLLGLTGLPDFASVDLNEPDDFEDFMNQLIFVEERINAQLGIL